MSSRPVRVSTSPPWVDISCQEGGLWIVRLGGRFEPTWMASLCEGIADHGLSIQTAHAMLSGDSSWVSELTLVEMAGATDPRHVPYFELSMQSLTATPLQLTVDTCKAICTADHGGSLHLTLEANDEIGLLGSLLSQLAEALWFPVEMHIETRAGRAQDELWLRSLTEQPLTGDTCGAIERMFRLAAPRADPS